MEGMTMVQTTKTAIRVGRYRNVDDIAAFERGPFTLEIYAHRHMPITYEVRIYHDIAEVRAFGLGAASERGATAHTNVTLEVLNDPRFPALDTVFGDLEHKLRELAT